MDSFLQTLRAVIRDDLADLNTMLIGRVTAVNMAAMRVDVKPVAMRAVTRRNNVDTAYTALPQLLDIPLAFPRSGAAQIVHKVAVGDVVEVRFCQHSMDEILTSDDYNEVEAQDLRRHALQDAVAIPIDFGDRPATSNDSDYEIIADDVRIGDPTTAKRLVTSELRGVLNQLILDINAAITAGVGNVAQLPSIPTTSNLRGS